MSSTSYAYYHDRSSISASHSFPSVPTTIPHAELTHLPRLERGYDYGQPSAGFPLGLAASQQNTSVSASPSLPQAESSGSMSPSTAHHTRDAYSVNSWPLRSPRDWSCNLGHKPFLPDAALGAPLVLAIAAGCLIRDWPSSGSARRLRLFRRPSTIAWE